VRPWSSVPGPGAVRAARPLCLGDSMPALSVRPSRRLAVAMSGVLAAAVTATGLVVAPAVSAAPAVPLSPCVDSDHGQPAITALRVSAPRVDLRSKARLVTFTAQIVDTGQPGAGSGVTSAEVSLQAPGSAQFATVPLSHGSGTTWQGQYRFQPGELRVSGRWRVLGRASDGAGNRSLQDASAFARPGTWDGYLRVRTTADRTAPRVTTSAVSRDAVDARRSSRRVRVDVRLADSRSGVRSVALRATAPATVTRARRTAGDLHRGRWTAWVTVPRYAGLRRVRLSVRLEDRAGNKRTVTAAALRRAHQPSGFDVRSRTDRSAPQITERTVSTQSLDVRTADGTVLVDVHVTDTGAGVSGGQVLLYDDAARQVAYTAPLRPQFGNGNDATWRAIVQVDHCTARSSTWTPLVQLTTYAGPTTSTRLADQRVSVTSSDTIAPKATATVSASRTNLVLHFDEAVTGVSDSSAVVMSSNGGSLSGTWSCADGPGLPTPCDGTSVWTATFTPTGQLLPSDGAVQLNPWTVLDLRDLAGNPAAWEQSVYFSASA